MAVEETQETEILLQGISQSDVSNGLWNLDAGSSLHMTGEKRLFYDLDESFKGKVVSQMTRRLTFKGEIISSSTHKLEVKNPNKFPIYTEAADIPNILITLIYCEFRKTR